MGVIFVDPTDGKQTPKVFVLRFGFSILRLGCFRSSKNDSPVIILWGPLFVFTPVSESTKLITKVQNRADTRPCGCFKQNSHEVLEY